MARSNRAQTSADESEFHVLDPLGEIKNRAKELLSEQGKNSGKSWRDFVEEAENDLLRADIALHHQISCIKQSIQSVPPKLAEARSKKGNPLLRAVSLSTATLLNLHEAFCLARMLNQSKFFINETATEMSPTKLEIAYILAELVEEYPEDAFKNNSECTPICRPIEEKLAFWNQQIEKWISEDRPLNFSDRNTIQRFHLRMIDSGIICNIQQRFS